SCLPGKLHLPICVSGESFPLKLNLAIHLRHLQLVHLDALLTLHLELLRLDFLSAREEITDRFENPSNQIGNNAHGSTSSTCGASRKSSVGSRSTVRQSPSQSSPKRRRMPFCMAMHWITPMSRPKAT